ncbi:MAG: hypothetical protein KF901_24725 [Myxococcales bacterium]|nr:hypothetical protein [Myxococcales bacterium]
MLRTLLLLALTSLCACKSSITEVVVVVDSDLDVPEALDRLQIDVSGPDGRREQATATLGAAETPLPRTLSLVHEGGVLGPFDVTVRGFRDEDEIVERRARFDFVPGQSLVLTMHLVRACVGLDCRPGTCSEDGCAGIERGPLPAWPGSAPRLGDPLPDAGPPDAGPPDAGPADVGPPDAPCEPREEECNGLDDDCDGAIDEDFDLQDDLANCGACGRQCVFRNGEGICNAGVCTVTSCEPPFEDCDGDGSNGCESDTQLSVNHCGTCRNVCRNPDRVCCSGSCQRSC